MHGWCPGRWVVRAIAREIGLHQIREKEGLRQAPAPGAGLYMAAGGWAYGFACMERCLPTPPPESRGDGTVPTLPRSDSPVRSGEDSVPPNGESSDTYVRIYWSGLVSCRLNGE